ncbi:PREDICTED: uncharacterized protein LOC104783631 [Camelina sativa]|uniref:Uncharacterized protein LOC104783631 n=1 Tax=Camelina sativa TaxID=90675 RepID=A0ABM0YWU8_CAMSA|nr:PREDICTED: uncharacterized protein LOC104783631 [Camelina sativa]
MGTFKSPSPDGFQPGFYQHGWDVVGPSVVHFVLELFYRGLLPEATNDALVVLISKVLKAELMSQFHPISLCGVLFKKITKTMVNRMKKVMPKLIGHAQSSFIPRRLSTNNIIVVQEAWDFLEETLKVADFSENWRQWNMQCVKGPSMTILWNGEKTTIYTIKRAAPRRSIVALPLCSMFGEAVPSH